MRKFPLAVAVVGVVLAGSVSSAQTSAVSGRVANAQGGVIPNAQATLRPVPAPGAPAMPNMPGMGERTASGGADGTFRFDQVAAGEYILEVDAPGFERSSQQITVPTTTPAVAVRLDPLVVPGAEAPPAAPAGATTADTEALLARIRELEQRITDLEASTVLSEPETRVRRVEVFVDESGNQLDNPAPGARPTVTYERERVYRRQTINEKIEEALAEADERSVSVGVDAAMGTQFAGRTRGDLDANKRAYALASADLFFTAGIAQNTIFFADIVGLSGSPPDAEIPSLTLLNGYTARLIRQNELNLREAWLRTELFGQRLALTAGRLDLTNYFDQNAIANDESTQFIGDALVNNQMLGLATNGTGVAAEFDPKNGFRFKFGFQQSNTDATNLSDSLYTLSEAGYTFTPFALPEGTYRVWFRTDNTSPLEIRKGFGVSLDQKVSAAVGLFGRYGTQEVDGGDRDHFYSAGVGFQRGLILNPQDAWGVGYARMDLASGEREDLVEGYYNLLLTERLRLSFHLTHVLDRPDAETRFGYLLPGVRFQAAF